MKKEALRKRYGYLWKMELLSAAMFPALLVWVAARHGAWENFVVRAYSVAVVAAILLQGTAWWRWKLAVLNGRVEAIPPRVLSRYRMWKRANWLLIGLLPVVVALAVWSRPQGARAADIWLGLLFLAGAVLEQINYYYYQLMYDTKHDWNYLRQHRRLRRGNIAAALDASNSARSGVSAVP
jgi:hypothetical protein